MHSIFPEITVTGAPEGCSVDLAPASDQPDLWHYTIELQAEAPFEPKPITLSWRFAAHNIQGMWTPDTLHEKRLRADWEQEVLLSRISLNAPVVCLFGHDDDNVHTFACADAIHSTALKAVIREENSFVYCHVTLFPEGGEPIRTYKSVIRIDSRPCSTVS